MAGPADRLLRAYDDQLRTEAETLGARSVGRSGPLWLITFGGGAGFVTYRDLRGADIPSLVATAVAHFAADPGIRQFEWKTRAHDVAPSLREALLDAGFVAGEPESVLVGEAELLVVDVPLPAGVTLRQLTAGPDVRALAEMQDEVFGKDVSGRAAEELLRRLADGEDVELWVAEAEGRIVSGGRLELVPGTDFAGIWGGATVPDWRGRGIYRALTAARARSALVRGRRYLHSDSTEMSRPILERSGLVQVTQTTPYVWNRSLG